MLLLFTKSGFFSLPVKIVHFSMTYTFFCRKYVESHTYYEDKCPQSLYKRSKNFKEV